MSVKSYIAAENILVNKTFWDPDANGGAGAEFTKQVPLSSKTLVDYIEYLEKRLSKIENDFQDYILLEKK